MEEPEWIAVAKQDTLRFDCNRSVPCFNQCCRDLNQALSPYDVLQLRIHLGLAWTQFLERFAVVRTGPATGLPVVSLRFSNPSDRRCPFVTETGCSVYPARPTSCRLYPVARMVRRSPTDGRLHEHYAIVKEAHCRGFEQAAHRDIAQWVQQQAAAPGLAAGDRLMEVIAVKNKCLPGPLSPNHQAWVHMAFYDLDLLKSMALEHRLENAKTTGAASFPDIDNDAQWLDWGLKWLTQALSDLAPNNTPRHHDNCGAFYGTRQ
jgi:uncharacterized protein